VPGPKLNEAPVLRRRPQSRSVAVRTPVTSARAVAKYVRISPYKVRQVLDLIRGYDAERAAEIL
jgi:ribosomal protein L22